MTFHVDTTSVVKRAHLDTTSVVNLLTADVTIPTRLLHHRYAGHEATFVSASAPSQQLDPHTKIRSPALKKRKTSKKEGAHEALIGRTTVLQHALLFDRTLCGVLATVVCQVHGKPTRKIVQQRTRVHTKRRVYTTTLTKLTLGLRRRSFTARAKRYASESKLPFKWNLIGCSGPGKTCAHWLQPHTV